MRAFLDHRPQDAFGRHRYDPADFGWTYPGLASEFDDYTERYRIEAEDAGQSPHADATRPAAGGANGVPNAHT